MTTKSQMETERDYWRALLAARPEFKAGEEFSTNDCAHWIGRDVTNAFHLLSVMDKDGMVVRRTIKRGGGSTRWRKAGSRRMSLHFRDWGKA